MRAECPPEHLDGLRQELDAITDEVFMYDKDYIKQTMGWGPEPQQNGSTNAAHISHLGDSLQHPHPCRRSLLTPSTWTNAIVILHLLP